jgi:HD superfamily phosphohydrolase
MHLQVYEHHTRIVADNMFLKSVKIALSDCGSMDKESLKLSNSNFLENYLKLDDYSVQNQILNGKNEQAKDLILRIRNRKLMKRALDISLNTNGIPDGTKRKKITELDRKQIEDIELKIAEESGINPAYIIIHVQNVKIKLYERFWELIEKKEKPIYVQMKDGTIPPLDEASPFSTSRNRVNRLYVFCPKKYVEKVRPIAKEKLGL